MVQGSKEWLDKNFPIVEASKLSLKDEFLQYQPVTNRQKLLKKHLIAGIKTGLKNFRKPTMDPSFKEGKIVYEAGLEPAIGKREYWWYENTKKFMPEKNSRLGIVTEYVAFLGVLIKYLVQETGYTVKDAWSAVCDNSRKIGHYADSENQQYFMETTGSCPVGIWFDLGNTGKLVVTTSEEIDLDPPDDSATYFLVAGGDWGCDGDRFPLVSMEDCAYSDLWITPIYVGWIVMDV